jgi:cobalt-zinc-cadmium efflux system membrane fusion protein
MRTALSRLIIIAGIFLAGELHAQGHIDLSSEEISRFGLEFSTVQEIDGSTGMRVPATIINSPLSVSGLTARYEGIIEGWDIMAGEFVNRDQLIGTINSQEVLDTQQEWILADSVLEQAQFNLDKDEILFAEGVISEQRLVQTRRNFQQARINAQVARQKLMLAGFTDRQLEALKENGDGLGLYYLRSPMEGQVSHLEHETGDYVTASTKLMSFSSGNLWVRVELPARLGQQLAIGQTLRLADSGQVLTLRLMDYAADENSQMLHVYGEFDSEVNRLPGQVTTLLLTPAGGGVLIPTSAVVHSANEAQVFIRTAGGVEVRTLTLIPVGGAYLAQSGIDAGDAVVTRGAAQLKGIQLGLGGE